MAKKKDGASGAGAGRSGRDRAPGRSGARKDHYDAIVDDYGPGGREWGERVRDELDTLPVEHLDGIGIITTDAPEGASDGDAGYYWPGDFYPAAGTYVGLSDDIGFDAVGDVHIHKLVGTEVGDPLRGVLVHEVGHHRQNQIRSMEAGLPRARTTEGLIGNRLLPQTRRMSSRELAEMGMTSYNTGSASEWLAGAYEVRYSGTPEQWAAVNKHTSWATSGAVDLGALFG